MTKRQAAVYLRGKAIYVRASALSSGARIEAGPATILDAKAGADVCGAAVVAALRASSGLSPAKYAEDIMAPLLQPVGAKTWSAFARRASHVTVEATDEQISFQSTRNEGRMGFVNNGDPIILRAGASDAEVGVALLSALERSS